MQVHCAALNFKDVLFATARLPMSAVPAGVSAADALDSLLGLEYAGIDGHGNRVMGLLPFKALASSVSVSEAGREFQLPMPDHWSFEEAATVPVVCSTVIYALLVRGKLQPKETVLIHAGAGGVGLAAINVCLHFDCTIITTCGSHEKRQFLKEYSNERISDDHILNSRDTSFEDEVLR